MNLSDPYPQGPAIQGVTCSQLSNPFIAKVSLGWLSFTCNLKKPDSLTGLPSESRRGLTDTMMIESERSKWNLSPRLGFLGLLFHFVLPLQWCAALNLTASLPYLTISALQTFQPPFLHRAGEQTVNCAVGNAPTATCLPALPVR